MADLKLSDSPNVDTGYVVSDEGKQNKVQLVANLPTDTLELPAGANSDSGYITVDGKKHRVKLTAVMYGGTGGGGSGEVTSVNGKKGQVILTGADINATVGTSDEAKTATITEHLSDITANAMTLQQEIDTNAGKTAELDADLTGKVDKAQGTENAGKFLKVGADGNVVLGDVDSGVTEVAHDDTLTGKGTTAEPLSVVKPAAIIREW